jgi:hypothetical protein
LLGLLWSCKPDDEQHKGPWLWLPQRHGVVGGLQTLESATLAIIPRLPPGMLNCKQQHRGKESMLG